MKQSKRETQLPITAQSVVWSCRQYATDTGALDGIGYKDMARVVGETWRALTPMERAPYEKLAQKEAQRYERDKRVYGELHQHFVLLQGSAKRAGAAILG